MAKHTSIEVLSNLWIGKTGINYKISDTETSSIRYFENDKVWKFNNNINDSNSEWKEFGSGEIFIVDEFPKAGKRLIY